MDFWFDDASSFERSPDSIVGDAMVIVGFEDVEIPPQFVDGIAMMVTRVAIHDNKFDEEACCKFVADVFITVCRFLGIKNSHECIQTYGLVDGFYSKEKIAILLDRVAYWAAMNKSTVLTQEIFMDKLRFSAMTVASGGGGLGTYARSVSRMSSPAPHHPDEQQQQQQQQQAPSVSDQKIAELMETMLTLVRKVTDSQAEGSRVSAPASVAQAHAEATLSLVADKSTWVATDDPLFAKDFSAHAHVLASIPRMKVLNERKGDLLNAIEMMSSIVKISEIASGDRQQWLKYVVGQLPSGKMLDSNETFAILSAPPIEMVTILLRVMHDRNVVGLVSGAAKPVAYHNLVKLARVAAESNFTPAAFRDLWNGKSAQIVLGGTLTGFTLNH